MDRDRADEDEVEGAAEELRRGLVDGRAPPFHGAAERPLGERKALPAHRILVGTQMRRPIELLQTIHVERRDCGAAALQLKCPKALERADIEYPQSLEVGRDAISVHVWTQ